MDSRTHLRRPIPPCNYCPGGRYRNVADLRPVDDFTASAKVVTDETQIPPTAKSTAIWRHCKAEPLPPMFSFYRLRQGRYRRKTQIPPAVETISATRHYRGKRTAILKYCRLRPSFVAKKRKTAYRPKLYHPMALPPKCVSLFEQGADSIQGQLDYCTTVANIPTARNISSSSYVHTNM